MNPKEALISISQREGVGKPSKSEVARFINIVFPKPRQAQLAYHRNEEFILAALKPLKDAYDERGESASRVKLAATMVLQGNGTELRNFADKALRERQIPAYRFFFDLYYGLRTTMFTLLLAEREISGEAQSDIANAISTEGKILSMSVSEQVQRSLAYSREAERDSSLLKQDPSGFMLIDDYLTDLQKETFSLLSEEYVMTGANLAADLYKSVYQISTNLTSV